MGEAGSARIADEPRSAGRQARLLAVDREVLVIGSANPIPTPPPADGGERIDQCSARNGHSGPHIVTAVQARQGVISGRVVLVLGASISLALLAMILAYLAAF